MSTASPYDPLDHARAAFTNHVKLSSPIGNYSSPPESSRTAAARLHSQAIGKDHAQPPHCGDDTLDDDTSGRDPAIDCESWDENGHARWQKAAVHTNSSPPKLNPFHLLSHPNSNEPLPPLPTHLQALASDEPGDPNLDHLRQTHVDTDTGLPLHITKVTHDSVRLVSGPISSEARPRRIIDKVSNVFRRENEVGPESRPISMQEPPPSPPLSDIVVDPEDLPDEEINDTSRAGDLQPYLPLSSPAVFTADLTAEPSEFASPPQTTGVPPIPRSVSGGSSSSRPGSLAIVRAGRLAAQRSSPKQPSAGRDSPLLPDAESLVLPSAAPRMSRRSTNPSPVSPNPQRSPLIHAQSTFSTNLRSQTFVPGVDGAALDSDILAQAETIRRERLERRQRKATADLEAPTKPAEPVKDETTRVLVGNLIGEDHVNYVLMYNMLTGIRIGVSRCQAKLSRPVTDEDYLARHKYSFDIVGNELTPSARYDFKFKDYAPWVFRDLREEHFHLDPADYLLSLTAKYILSELGSPGKSGSFFYFSRDYRFIIKTISHSEHQFLRSILKDYHEHVRSNPHTLLSRFYGLHRVKLPRGRKIHFVIMNNLFPPHRDVHETYDLKGSAFGREYPEEKAKLNPKATLKDRNWVNRGRTLELGPEKRALLSEQLRRDMEFLKHIRVMDYSLLVGIHNMERGNRDNIRENQLSVFHPNVPVRRKPSAAKPASEASNVRKAIRRSDPKTLDVTSQLPTADSADRRHFLFYQDEGGLRATDEANQNMDVIYYLGIIDICTPYNAVKKFEHLWKSMTEDRQTISCVEPVTYGQRFLNFLLSIMRGGDLSLRPQGLLPQATEEKPVGSEHGEPAQEGEQSGQQDATVGHLKAE